MTFLGNESCVDLLVTMKIVGHRDYQTTETISTHLSEDVLRKATVNMGKVFRSRAG